MEERRFRSINHGMNNDNEEYADAYEEEEEDDDDEEPEEAWVRDDEMDFFDADEDDGEEEAVSSTEQQQQQHQQQQQEESTLPLPREHSYLAGASHPLVVRVDGANPPTSTNDHLSSSISSSSSSSSPINELAILELQGVVLFPGSTIPVKLRDPSLIAYLGHQIEVCRTVPHRQPKVCLGIVTYTGRRRRGRDHRPSTAVEDGSSQNHPHHTHRLVGRIGTIATIQYTQERTDSLRNPTATTTLPHVWGRYQELNELVFTAVGTGRFEVVGPTTATNGGSVFAIRELKDVPLLPPPMGRLFTTIPSSASKSSPRPQQQEDEEEDPLSAPSSSLQHQQQPLGKHDQVLWNLSNLTPIPYFVYQRNWPWRLKDELMFLLQENQGRSNLPQLSTGIPSANDPTSTTNGTTTTATTTPIDHSFFQYKSPTQFSFWLSGNMPFTQSERLELLEMSSTLERLRVLRQKILSLIQQRMMCYVGCTRCHNPLAPVSEIFSFDGAEGATSNYVNDHGYIHQITTLRSVLDERHLHFQGPPSTSNSYFPGYSWTITYCRYCSSLLGWKFQKVARRGVTSGNTTGGPSNNPETFFGFQSASVRTMQDENPPGVQEKKERMPAPAALAVPTAMVALKRLAVQASAYYTPEVATAVTSATCAAMVAQWIWKVLPVWIKEDISFRTLFLLNYDEEERREELSHLASVLKSLHRMTSSMEELYEIPQLHAAILAYMQWSGQMKQMQLENSISIDKTLHRDYGYHSAGQSISLDQVRSKEHQEALEFATWAYHRDGTKLTRLLQERDYQVVMHDQSTRPGYVSFYAAVSGITREIRIGVRGTSTLEDLVTDCCGHAVPFRHEDDTDERGRIEVEASRILSEVDLVSSMDINDGDNHGDKAAVGSDCSSDKSQHEAEVMFDFKSIRVEDDDSQGDNHIRCHEGILLSAQRMCKKLRPIIQTWAVDAGYRVVLCGHSLGGGAATLAGLILRAEYSKIKVQVYAFAPPPVLDHDSAIASASFVTSFVHNADMIPRCSLFNLVILLQGLKRFHHRLVERGMNPTGPKTTAAFLRQLFSTCPPPQEEELSGIGENPTKENESDNPGSNGRSGSGDAAGEVEDKMDMNATNTITSNLLLTLEEWREAIDEGTPDFRKTEHLFVPGRVLLIYSPWKDDYAGYNRNTNHENPHHPNVDTQDYCASSSLTTSPAESLPLRCVETDGTCPALRMIEADGPRLFTDHISSSYYEAMGMTYQF